MRKNARSWGIRVALGIIALVFVFFMGGGGQIGGGPSAVVTVAGESIEVNTFERARARNESLYRQEYGDNLTPELLAALDIPSLTLNQLVESALLRQEAERLSLSVPDDAVRSAIRAEAAFQIDGRFSPSVYRAGVQRSGTSPAAFEASLRRDMLVEQLLDIVRRGVHVTEEEAFERFALSTEKMVLSYIKVEGSSVADEVVADEEAIRGYFTENQETYREPAKVTVRYVAYSPSNFADPDSIAEEEIEEYYVLNESEFTTEETVTARHILKKADDEDEARAAARKAIDAVAQRLAAGEDFAEVAKEESEDPGSAVGGGDLGAFGRGRMVQEFEEAAFSLDVGETSGVVESQYGFHIINVTARDAGGLKSIDDVRTQIADTLAKERAGEKAFDYAAGDALDLREGRTSLEKVANERGLEVRTSPKLARGEPVPGLPGSRPISQRAFELDEIGAISDPVQVGDGYHVLRLESRAESRIPQLDEVRDRVVDDYSRDAAKKLARAKASALLAKIEGGKPIAQVAADAGLEVAETSEFVRSGDFIDGIGNVRGLKEVAFDVRSDAEPLPRPFVHRGDAYVFVRKSLTTAERDEFAEQRADVMTALRTEKERATIAEFLRRLKASNQISFNRELLDQLLQ